MVKRFRFPIIKTDSGVVFLFIDVWENKMSGKMAEAAIKVMKNDNYSINVLLDIDDKVVNLYKVDGIPKKLIIDRKGNLIYTGDKSGTIVSKGDSIEDLSLIIEEAKKINELKLAAVLICNEYLCN